MPISNLKTEFENQVLKMLDDLFKGNDPLSDIEIRRAPLMQAIHYEALKRYWCIREEDVVYKERTVGVDGKKSYTRSN